ncbi:MAG: hypothetical protein ACI84C_002046 [Flavobacteriales bacterium]|jgi:hypothetical protein
MKQFIVLFAFTLGLTFTGFANNGEANGDPEKPEEKQEYTFSLSRGYLQLFNLFSVEPAKVDTTSLDQRKMPHELSEIK